MEFFILLDISDTIAVYSTYEEMARDVPYIEGLEKPRWEQWKFYWGDWECIDAGTF